MITDYKKYSVIQNGGLGTCHILDKCDNGYLVYSQNNGEHFIICDAIFESGYLSQTVYFEDLTSAVECFNELKKENTLLK